MLSIFETPERLDCMIAHEDSLLIRDPNAGPRQHLRDFSLNKHFLEIVPDAWRVVTGPWQDRAAATCLAGQVSHHGVENEHARRRAPQTRIAEAFDVTVIQQVLFSHGIGRAARKRLPACEIHTFPQSQSHE